MIINCLFIIFLIFNCKKSNKMIGVAIGILFIVQSEFTAIGILFIISGIISIIKGINELNN